MDVEERRAIGRRLRRVREGMGWDRNQLADWLGIHPGSIARWETGGSVPQAYHLERIADWGGVDPEWVRTGEGAPPPGERDPWVRGSAEGRAVAEAETEDFFSSFDAVVRFLGGIAPAGEERLRKLDALEGLRRMLTARGLLPDWWYRLREQVESDEL